MNYKKILEGVVNIINTTEKSDIGFANICTYIGESCPELAESEDEKIRKNLIGYIKGISKNEVCEETKDSWIAWLEKQGEQKPAIEMKSAEESLGIDSDTYNKIVDECIYGEQKPVDKVEPKFHEGEWTVSNLDGKARQISEVHFDEHNNYYVVNGMPVNLEEYDRRHRLWSIKDAKDGDILSNGDSIVIFRGIGNEKWNDVIDYQIGLFTDSQHLVVQKNLSHWGRINEVTLHPATKEQRDLLFAEMKDVGYEWDAEKKELKKIEQKPAWSEEDENRINRLIAYFEDKESFTAEDDVVYANWLKSLKDRVQPKQEWSEEDESLRLRTIGALETCKIGFPTKCVDEQINWLKSLKPQNRWKPSDEQLNALHDAAVYVDKSMFPYPKGILMKLYKQLKKLGEE